MNDGRYALGVAALTLALGTAWWFGVQIRLRLLPAWQGAMARHHECLTHPPFPAAAPLTPSSPPPPELFHGLGMLASAATTCLRCSTTCGWHPPSWRRGASALRAGSNISRSSAGLCCWRR